MHVCFSGNDGSNAVSEAHAHTYFYKKLPEYGKDHDLKIKEIVHKEGNRKTAVLLSEKSKVNDVESVSSNQTIVTPIEVKIIASSNS